MLQGNSAPDAADKTESDNGDDVTEPETTAEVSMFLAWMCCLTLCIGGSSFYNASLCWMQDMDTAESMKPEGHAELDTGDDIDAELQALAEVHMPVSMVVVTQVLSCWYQDYS